MKNDVSIPMSMGWSKDEIIDVVNFYEAIDQTYGKGVERGKLMSIYQKFKKVVPSKSEEKQHFNDYESQTNQSPYHVIKKAKESSNKIIIKM